MRVVRLTHVDQRQHHEDERLQRNDQDVEDRPHRSRNHVPDTQPETAREGVELPGPYAAHQGDQHEDEFAGKHVAEQSHAVRDGLGDEFDDLHQEVDRPQHRVRAKRGGDQLVPVRSPFWLPFSNTCFTKS